MDQTALDNLLQPKTVAVVGASAQPGKIGYTVIENLLEGGYNGKIYPINPTATEILGLKVFPTIADVPGKVDLAVITVPVKFVAQVSKECGEKGIKALSVITSGFSEVGRKDLEDELVDIAHQYGMCVLGPNIVGTLSNSDKLNASFAPFLPFPGKATLITQSGALLIAMDAITYTRKVGFDKMISIGNMADSLTSSNGSRMMKKLPVFPSTSKAYGMDADLSTLPKSPTNRSLPSNQEFQLTVQLPQLRIPAPSLVAPRFTTRPSNRPG